MKRIFPLTAVTNRIKQLLADAESTTFWVQANFVSENAQRSGGHLYGALVEHDAQGNVIARMRASVWQSNRDLIEAKLKKVGITDALDGHREICAKCAVQYHAVHGLSLSILDVDPEFSESQLDQNRRAVLERLTADGLLDVNQQLTITAAPLRVGLITATGSAAHADFIQTLTASGFAFSITVVSAKMQGAMIRSSVGQAIRYLESQHIDLLCLVRGGGSPVDLAGFDDEQLGRRIAACRIPVWTGIGHEIDVTVPDFVAHTTFKTPTAVAAELVKMVQSQWDRLEMAAQQVRDVCDQRFENANKQLNVSENGLRQGTRKHLLLQEERFDGRQRQVKNAVRRQVSDKQSLLKNAVVQLQERAASSLAREEERLNNYPAEMVKRADRRIAQANERLCNHVNQLRKSPRAVERCFTALEAKEKLLSALRPERMLERGYSLTTDNDGRVIRDVTAVKVGDTIRTRLANGTLKSQVTEAHHEDE